MPALAGTAWQRGVTIGAVLAAVAGDVGGALGSQVRDGVSALVRRPFHRSGLAGPSTAAVASGEEEPTAMAQAPGASGEAMPARGSWELGNGCDHPHALSWIPAR